MRGASTSPPTGMSAGWCGPGRVESVWGVARPRAHRKLVAAILVVATLLGLLSVLSIWVKRQALETDTWTATSTKLLENEKVNEALSAYLVETLYANVDVQGELEGALPPAAKALAGPAGGGATGGAPSRLPPKRWRDRRRRASESSPANSPPRR